MRRTAPLLRALALAATLGAAHATATAQTAPQPGTPGATAAGRRPPAPSEAAKREIVDSLVAVLERTYADPDTGRLIAQHVRRRNESGAYRSLDDWQRFARAVTQDLQAVNGDTHLWLELEAPQAGAAPAAAAAPHGVERVERLDGNVGYLRMSGFGGGDAAFEAVEGALRQLATTGAVILDLRNSRGGSAALANFVISHFMPADTVLSLTTYRRPQNATTHRYTLATVPGPRRPTVPLYVLTDDVTRSAAEDVPFVLQNFGRARIVGGQTAGAGRNNTFVPMPYGTVASVSFTRVMEPGTGREWERVGITPDVRVPADSALHVAHRLALDTLVALAPAGQRRALELTREAAVAARRGERVPAATLRRYVGTYEGGQSIALEDGALVYQPRVAQPRVTLVPLAPTRFADGATRYEFLLDGGTPRLRITLADGSTTTYARESTTLPERKR